MIWLVRHGRTAANAAGLLQGRIDNPLDDIGLEQARCVAGALAGLTGTVTVVSSPLRRALDTAAGLGFPVTVDPRWIELDYGDWDGIGVQSVPAVQWQAWRDDVTFAPPGGESLHVLGERVRAACADMAEAARTGHVVVVSHVSPIKAALAWALGAGVEVSWRIHLDTASISQIAVSDRGPVVRRVNDVAHLADT